MVEFGSLVSFVVLTLLMASVPGPTVLYVMSQGLHRDSTRSVCAILGIALSNLIWITLCALGVAAIVRESQVYFSVLRLLGACYLVYLGVRHWSESSQSLVVPTAPSVGYRLAFCKGFLTSISNPKALVYYLSFLPQFVQDGPPVLTQLLTLGLINIFMLSLVLLVYSSLVIKLSTVLQRPGVRTLANRAIGTLFVGFGFSLLRYEGN